MEVRNCFLTIFIVSKSFCGAHHHSDGNQFLKASPRALKNHLKTAKIGIGKCSEKLSWANNEFKISWIAVCWMAFLMGQLCIF